MRYLIALLITLFVSASGAIEPPKQDKPPPSTATPPTAPEREPTAETPPPADAPVAEEQEETLPPLPEDTAVGPSPARFNPTEKVRADFPVSFPIDI